jgi:hypothetical protein
MHYEQVNCTSLNVRFPMLTAIMGWEERSRIGAVEGGRLAAVGRD